MLGGHQSRRLQSGAIVGGTDERSESVTVEAGNCGRLWGRGDCGAAVDAG